MTSDRAFWVKILLSKINNNVKYVFISTHFLTEDIGENMYIAIYTVDTLLNHKSKIVSLGLVLHHIYLITTLYLSTQGVIVIRNMSKGVVNNGRLMF